MKSRSCNHAGNEPYLPDAMTRCGELIIRTLEAHGVDTMFGIPGNHTLELYRGLADSPIRHIPTKPTQKSRIAPSSTVSGSWLDPPSPS